MKIQALVLKDSGIHFHRLVNPLAYLPIEDGVEVELLHIGEQEQRIDCDILIYNKWCATPVERIKELQAQGMKVIVDVDDLWYVPKSHPNYPFINDNNIDKLTEEHIKLADLVICTTLRLQDKVRELNKNTAVIPNALPFGRDQYTVGDRVRGRELSANNKTRFMYLAGSTHKKDVDILAGKFERIGGDSHLNSLAEFILCGYNPTYKKVYASREDAERQTNKFTTQETPGEYDHMAAVFRKTKSFKIYPSVDLEYYLNYYDSADVAIAPLCDNTWNSYKSPLKLIEAGCKHIPIICSAVAPYTDIVEFKNEGVMLVERLDQWIAYIRYCTKNPNFVTDEGERLYAWTSEQYDLIKWNRVRQQLFTHLTTK
jgi:hypothetical protein